MSIDDATNYPLTFDAGKRGLRRNRRNVTAIDVAIPLDVSVEDNAVATEVVTQERASRSYSAYTAAVGPNPSLIVGDDSGRSRLVLCAIVADVHIGHLDALGTDGTGGFTLPLNVPIEMYVTGAVYAVLAGTAVPAVSVLVERDD